MFTGLIFFHLFITGEKKGQENEYFFMLENTLSYLVDSVDLLFTVPYNFLYGWHQVAYILLFTAQCTVTYNCILDITLRALNTSYN